MTNKQLSELLANISAAYQILGENRFKILAYDKASVSVKQLTQEIYEIWKQGKLEEIPGVGKGIAQNIEELLQTGKCLQFEEVLSKVPESVFPLLFVPGIGPKKAFTIVSTFQLTNKETVIDDIEKLIEAHKIAALPHFGEKSEEAIRSGIESYKRGQMKEQRMNLPEADLLSKELIAYLMKHSAVERVDVLGSLRRKRSTIGDIDLAVITETPNEVLTYFCTFPHEKIIDKGEKGATILLHNGKLVDIRVQKKSSYGAMLQYFTGSKQHNIHVRKLALEHGFSLSEHGLKDLKTQKLHEYPDEEKLYEFLGLKWIPPELREDKGEIEASRNEMNGDKPGLPKLVEQKDLKGDLHMHTNYEFPTSHDLGVSHIHEHLDKAVSLGYEYIGISDHNPKISGHTAKHIARIMEKRYEWYKEQHNLWTKRHPDKNVAVFVMCEVDILSDGALALPDEAFDFVDAVIVSIHSSFRQSKEDSTRRIIQALTAHTKVKIFGHPTGRLLLERDGVEADWNTVMDVCRERSIAMEINSYPDRLDLPDLLVYEALHKGVQFTIDTDAHAVEHMDLASYGISVARRGWAEKKDILNTQPLDAFSTWLKRN